VEQAADDLAYFHQLANAAAVSEIRVTAFDTSTRWLRIQGGRTEVEGMPGVQVTVDGPGGRQSATTDASGRHTFRELAPGEYRVTAALEGYGLPVELRPVRVHSKGCAEVPLPMSLNRRVSGIVRTSDGQPAAGVTVECVPTRPRHENDIPNAADSSTTDASGRYELSHLTTGEYYLGVSLSRSPKPDHPYTRWFYPGTELPAKAAIVHVSNRPELQSFDLVLPPRQGSRLIQGSVIWPDGRAAAGVRIHLEDPRWPWQVFMVSTITDGQGRFNLRALDGTTYHIHAVAGGAGPTSAEPVRIERGGKLPELKLILIRKGDSVRQLAGQGLEDWRKGLGLR
jgi:5-hydroxyisourate hydrolase-like protein (transthyretin family)